MTIVPFPVDREVRFVRDTALQLDRRSGRLAEKYWRTECNRLFGRLQVQGFAEPIIREQIGLFAVAVREELERLTGFSWHGRGGDVA